MNATIAWTRRAEQQLQKAASRLAAHSSARPEIDRRLALAFPQSRDVIVLNYYVGFKPREGEHILRVDVHFADTASTYVLKLAGHERLLRELTAWQQCSITDSDPVFMKLVAIRQPGTAELCAIAYQDAETHIGAELNIWLETAVRRCVRFDSPGLASILTAIDTIYVQLDTRLYANARVEAQPSGPIKLMPAREPGSRYALRDSLKLWQSPLPKHLRQRLNAVFPVGEQHFIDPVDYFAWLDEHSQGLPSLHRGRAHGDLHGRNSLVGIAEEEQAFFPTLFDYESIHADNLVGWDFVEMELELKLRCYEDIFKQPQHERCWAIRDLEWQLATDAANLVGGEDEWRVGPTTSAAERLRRIILTIRRAARRTMNRGRGDPLDWLREYLFLLGAYGITSVRYDNQTQLEKQAGYVSTGVAAAYLLTLQPRPTVSAETSPTYQWPLQQARQRNRQADNLIQAEEELTHLTVRYPTALQVWYEWCLNALNRGDTMGALERLNLVEQQFGNAMDEDTYCLRGRIYKEAGDRSLQRVGAGAVAARVNQIAYEEAVDHYGKAIACYEKGLAVKRGFFPAINIATLRLLCAGLCHRLNRETAAREHRAASHRQAHAVIHDDWKLALPDDELWYKASKAEAELLRGDWQMAAERYQTVLHRPECQSFHEASMGKQIRRIQQCYHLLGESIPTSDFQLPARLHQFLTQDVMS